MLELLILLILFGVVVHGCRTIPEILEWLNLVIRRIGYAILVLIFLGACLAILDAIPLAAS